MAHGSNWSYTGRTKAVSFRLIRFSVSLLIQRSFHISLKAMYILLECSTKTANSVCGISGTSRSARCYGLP